MYINPCYTFMNDKCRRYTNKRYTINVYIHSCIIYTLYIHSFLNECICFTIGVYIPIYPTPSPYTFTLYLHATLSRYTFTLHLHATPSRYTYTFMLYIHVYTFMLYIHVYTFTLYIHE